VLRIAPKKDPEADARLLRETGRKVGSGLAIRQMYDCKT
jgi:hypothetical protein